MAPVVASRTLACFSERSGYPSRVTLRAAVLLSGLLALAGCGSSSPGDLTVELHTDYLPGVEFWLVETVVVTAPSGSTVATGDTQIHTANAMNDYTLGVPVAELMGVGEGPILLQVRLYVGSTLVAERPVRVDVGSGMSEVVSVLVSRECGSTSCSPENACVGGACVDARCSYQDRGSCEEAVCTDSSTCTEPAAACAMARCDDGLCIQVAREGACVGGVCHPDDGCIGGEPWDAGGADAGPSDAAAGDAATDDGGPPDAGPPDAGAEDSGPPDAGPPDAGAPDAGSSDAGPTDAAVSDAATP